MPEGVGHIDYPFGSSDYPKHLGKRVGRRGMEERWPQKAIETLPAEEEVAGDLIDERRGVVRKKGKEEIKVDETVRRALENLPSLEKVVSAKDKGIPRQAGAREMSDEEMAGYYERQHGSWPQEPVADEQEVSPDEKLPFRVGSRKTVLKRECVLRNTRDVKGQKRNDGRKPRDKK